MVTELNCYYYYHHYTLHLCTEQYSSGRRLLSTMRPTILNVAPNTGKTTHVGIIGLKPVSPALQSVTGNSDTHVSGPHVSL